MLGVPMRSRSAFAVNALIGAAATSACWLTFRLLPTPNSGWWVAAYFIPVGACIAFYRRAAALGLAVGVLLVWAALPPVLGLYSGWLNLLWGLQHAVLL